MIIDSDYNLVVAETRVKLKRALKRKVVEKFYLEQLNVDSKKKELQEKNITE